MLARHQPTSASPQVAEPDIDRGGNGNVVSDSEVKGKAVSDSKGKDEVVSDDEVQEADKFVDKDHDKVQECNILNLDGKFKRATVFMNKATRG